ncbi:cytochrome c1 [Methyloglobulus sp.]|uniref:cytochrome c1 n=1 Tax=Methyloglobulus sp. TaxID=2518622 RepID=UPI0032B7BC9E
MKNIFITILLLALSFGVVAEETAHLQHANIDPTDNESLQRGAKHFVTYCLGCHSIKHIRYQRMSLDFGIDDKKVLSEIAPQGATIYKQMHTAMNAHDSEKWFGIQPPDLSLAARSRSADWIYSYLKSFYTDPKKPLGTNNLVFKDVGMPNVFWQLQGEQKALFKTGDSGQEEVEQLVVDVPGTLSEQEFDTMINDLVNFLVYVGEPIKLERERMGKYVLFFLGMFLVIAYLLKKEYWKDVH